MGYSGSNPTSAPTFAALTGAQVVSGSMTMSGFTVATFTAAHQTTFKSTLKTKLGITALADSAITLTVSSRRRLSSSNMRNTRSLSAGITVTYEITGVSDEVATSVIATLADTATFNSQFASSLSANLASQSLTVPSGFTVAVSSPTKTTTPPTKAPTVAATTALGGATSHTVDTLAVLATVAVMWASTTSAMD